MILNSTFGANTPLSLYNCHIAKDCLADIGISPSFTLSNGEIKMIALSEFLAAAFILLK